MQRPRPFDGEGDAADAGDGGTAGDDGGQSDGGEGGEGGAGNPSEPTNPFAELDGDSRAWLETNGAKDVASLAKLAREQASLLGNAVRVPGDDATPEERDAFLSKLGRPAEAKDYEFAPPKDFPEDLPYDQARADGFKDLAHSIGLTKAQATAIHDWAATNAVTDFSSAAAAAKTQREAIAKQETQKLEKRWGPLDGETAKANLAFADTVIREIGGEEAVTALKDWGLLTEENLLQDERLAVMFANMGMSMFKEDDVLRGKPEYVGNPFAEGEHFNVTAQHRMAKADPDRARSLITAAGGKPADFGL